VVWSAAAALLLTLVALAGIVGWAVRDHAERQARFADDVRAVLEKARWFQGQGKWAQARATAEQAEKLLAGGEVGEKLERRVHELNADLRMVASREEIGILGGWGKDGHSDEQKDRAYAAAFRDYGIDVETLDAGEAAGLIRRRTICVELAAALDDWAQKRRRLGRTGSKGWEGLLAVARAADPDPWRTKIRDAIAREDRRALKQLAASRSVCMVPPVEVVSLAGHLAEGGELDRATSLLRQAQAEHPEDFWINHTLGYYLGNRPAPRWDEAIPYFRVVVALRPDSPGARVNLGIALAGKGRLDDAGNSFRRAIQLKPDCAEAYHPFGLALHKQGRLNQAVAALRRLVELRRESAEAHHDLGNVLLDFGKFDQAADAYHRAIALEPEHARAHCNLGWALGEQGKFAQALAALERGHALGSRRPGWSWPSGRWVEECRRMAALAGRLPAVLRGEDRPADAAERDALALLCHEKKLYVAAARLRAEGLAAEPTLAEDLNAGHRFRAAGAATRAGSGEGADAGEADDKERARWREQALAWLRADLAAYRKLVEGGKPKDCQMVRRRLERWRGGQELASQFSRAPAIRPSESEQRAWIQLWADVQALMIKADAAEAAGQGEQ
jgi:Flp pilus assembly protein TadD